MTHVGSRLQFQQVALSAKSFYSAWTQQRINLFQTRKQDFLPGHLAPVATFQVVLFVSHRWERPTGYHPMPDPHNTHAKKVHQFLVDTFDGVQTNYSLHSVYQENRRSLSDLVNESQEDWDTFLRGIGI